MSNRPLYIFMFIICTIILAYKIEKPFIVVKGEKYCEISRSIIQPQIDTLYHPGGFTIFYEGKKVQIMYDHFKCK